MPVTPLTAAGAPDLVSDVAIRFQMKLAKYNDDNIKQLYAREPWTDGDGRKMTFQTYELPTWGEERNEYETPSSDSLSMGTQIEENFRAISKSFEVTDFMLRFDREKTAEDISSRLLEACMREYNLQLAHRRLTYADTLNYQPSRKSYTRNIGTPDGVALGGAHTVPDDPVSGTTYSNILANKDPLTEEAITNLIAQLQKTTVADNAELVPINIDTLVIPDYHPMVKRATQILKTPNVPFTFENTINFYAGGSMKLAVLKMGAIARDHTYADATQDDGTGVTATARSFHWGVLDSSMVGGLKYAIAGNPEVYKAPPTKNGLYSIRANMFVADVATRWQGTGFSFATEL